MAATPWAMARDPGVWRTRISAIQQDAGASTSLPRCRRGYNRASGEASDGSGWRGVLSTAATRTAGADSAAPPRALPAWRPDGPPGRVPPRPCPCAAAERRHRAPRGTEPDTCVERGTRTMRAPVPMAGLGRLVAAVIVCTCIPCAPVSDHQQCPRGKRVCRRRATPPRGPVHVAAVRQATAPPTVPGPVGVCGGVTRCLSTTSRMPRHLDTQGSRTPRGPPGQTVGVPSPRSPWSSAAVPTACGSTTGWPAHSAPARGRRRRESTLVERGSLHNATCVPCRIRHHRPGQTILLVAGMLRRPKPADARHLGGPVRRLNVEMQPVCADLPLRYLEKQQAHRLGGRRQDGHVGRGLGQLPLCRGGPEGGQPPRIARVKRDSGAFHRRRPPQEGGLPTGRHPSCRFLRRST
jgi:hypothetical protein